MSVARRFAKSFVMKPWGHAVALTLSVWAVLVVGGLILESDSVRPRGEAEPSQARDTAGPAHIIPYTVMSGDTISGIAAMFGITPDALARADRMRTSDPYLLQEPWRAPSRFGDPDFSEEPWREPNRIDLQETRTIEQPQ